MTDQDYADRVKAAVQAAQDKYGKDRIYCGGDGEFTQVYLGKEVLEVIYRSPAAAQSNPDPAPTGGPIMTLREIMEAEEVSPAPTPRTDAELQQTYNTSGVYVFADFARQLERELAEAKAENDRWEKLELAVIQTKDREKLAAERDKLRELLAECLAYLESGHGKVNWYNTCKGRVLVKKLRALAPEEGK